MLPASVRIFVCTTPVDMRRSFDRLAVCARELAGEDPQGGAMFVFIGKAATRLKVLWWDQNGYCLLYKRLHRAIFEMPRSQAEAAGGAPVRIDGTELRRLLSGVAREHAKK